MCALHPKVLVGAWRRILTRATPPSAGETDTRNLKPEACVWPLDVDEEAWFRGTHAFILAPLFPSYTGACVAS